MSDTLRNSPDLDNPPRYSASGERGLLRDAERGNCLVRCFFCEGQADPGRIETDNNGPIVNCPLCNPGKGG